MIIPICDLFIDHLGDCYIDGTPSVSMRASKTSDNSRSKQLSSGIEITAEYSSERLLPTSDIENPTLILLLALTAVLFISRQKVLSRTSKDTGIVPPQYSVSFPILQIYMCCKFEIEKTMLNNPLSWYPGEVR
jgi:hypothetical protein